jgi:hypothetical protein
MSAFQLRVFPSGACHHEEKQQKRLSVQNEHGWTGGGIQARIRGAWMKGNKENEMKVSNKKCDEKGERE